MDKIGSAVIFITFKTIHIPAFLSYISFLGINFPYADTLLTLLTWTNITLAIFPLLSAYITIFRKKHETIDKNCYKHVNIIMPIYNEDPETWTIIKLKCIYFCLLMKKL
jgi:hypothetical protein